jgi:Ca2+-transporting ATPase
VLAQLKSPLVYILLVAAGVTFFLGDYEDTVIISFSVVLNTILGRYQESKAGKALQALKELLQPTIPTLRNGTLITLATKELVPGDIILCKSGCKIPADGIIQENTKLTVSEAMLTGESLPIEKKDDAQVFMGTVVLSWSAYVEITTTGASTELGKIATSLQWGETVTPLQKQLQYFSKQLTWIVVGIVLVVFVIWLIRGQSPVEIFTTAVALAVGAIPEGLLVALTIVLTIGMQRILKRKGLVKNLVSAETLGGVTVICSDKTWTLTHGVMEVVDIIWDKEAIAKEIMYTTDDDNAVSKAIITWAQKQTTVIDEAQLLDKSPFASERKYAASLYTMGSITTLYVTWAPDYLMGWSQLSTAEKEQITTQINTLTEQGYRLIACAKKEVATGTNHITEDLVHTGLTWEGIICLADPVREDVKEALQKTQAAGIKLIVITGDYPGTARAIMEKLGVAVEDDAMITGDILEAMSDAELDTWLAHDSRIKLFARTQPAQKMRIVQALKDDGEVVAMMGDGVNDAPALKKADIGIVVWEATEVAKESADLILMDSSFSTIVAAVEEGRWMFDNIRKIILYLLCDAFVQIIAILIAILTGYPLPISASQILWINLVSDGLPNIALTVDPIRKWSMQRAPRSPKEHLVARWMKQLIGLVSTIWAICSFLLFVWVYLDTNDVVFARSVAFASFGIASLIYVFSVRTLSDPVWKENPFNNIRLLIAVLWGLALLIAPYLLPWLGKFLAIVPIGRYWIDALGVAAIMFIFIEIYKKLYKKELESS